MADELVDAMEIAVTSDGNFLVIERTGAVKLAEIKSGEVKTIVTLEVALRKKNTPANADYLESASTPNSRKTIGSISTILSKKNPSIASPGSLSRTTNSSMKKSSREALVCGANNQCHHPQHHIEDTLQMLEASLQFPVK